MDTQTIPLETSPVIMVSDGGTVYDLHGNSIGIAAKGTLWFTRYMEWKPGGTEDEVWVGLENERHDWTWAFPTEISQPPGHHSMRRKRWRYHG